MEKNLEDGDKVKRFRQFVNSEHDDSGVILVREREQLRPARENEVPKLLAVAD